MKGKACPQRRELTGQSFIKKVTTHYGSEGQGHFICPAKALRATKFFTFDWTRLSRAGNLRS
jgi:hypothetical protein